MFSPETQTACARLAQKNERIPTSKLIEIIQEITGINISQTLTTKLPNGTNITIFGNQLIIRTDGMNGEDITPIVEAITQRLGRPPVTPETHPHYIPNQPFVIWEL